MIKVLITERAKSDISAIYQYSFDQFGLNTAEEYLNKIEFGISLLSQQSELLLYKPNISESFKLFKVGVHWLVCDRVGDTIYILTLKHTSMNLIERLNDLRPTLKRELLTLRNRLKS